MNNLAEKSSPPTAAAPQAFNRFWLVLGAFWALLLALAVLRPLAVPDEGRYAEIGRWMLMSGDWLTPRLNGLPFFHKPPLLHWLQASSFGVFGVSPWAARLVPALHAGLMLVMLYGAVQRFADEALARRAALMLATSLSFLVGGQYVNHDMLVAAWMGVAIWAFALSFMQGPRPDRTLAWLGYAACALGVLSKGLIGLALPGLVLLLWLAATRQLRKLLYLPWASGLLLFAALAVPWFVLAQHRYSGSFDYMFGVHQFGRYVGRTFNNPQPWWFYGPALLLLFFPWLFFVPGALRYRGRAAAPSAEANTQPTAAGPAIGREWLMLCWIWLFAIGGFFSVPRSKLVGYILPVMPPLAVLAALGWQHWMQRRAHAARWFGALAALPVAIATLVCVLFWQDRLTVRLLPQVWQDQLTVQLAPQLACEVSRDDTLYVLGDYPYDLPFYLQVTRPMVVVQDWPTLRKSAGDSWRRELFEGGDFDPAAASVLQTPDVLATASGVPGNWLVVSRRTPPGDWQQGWQLASSSVGWDVYRSTPTRAASASAESPPAAQHKRLPGCKH